MRKDLRDSMWLRFGVAVAIVILLVVTVDLVTDLILHWLY
jgi:hypothetical protein